MFVMNRIHVNKRSDFNFILNISYLTLCLHLNQQKNRLSDQLRAFLLFR